MVLKYRFLGKGYTDEDGVAHMTEDADGQSVTGYTGTGRGLTDIVASTDDSTHISDSSILSETYALLDCTAYDTGILGTATNIYDTLNNLTRGSDGTVFTGVVWSNRLFKNGNSTDFNNTGWVVEIEVVSLSSNNAQIIINDGANNPNILQQGLNKFTFEGGVIRQWLDGIEQTVYDPSYDNTVSTVKLGIRLSDASCSLKFKNVKVYPI